MAVFPRHFLLYASSLLIGLALGHLLAHRPLPQAAPAPPTGAVVLPPESRDSGTLRPPPAPSGRIADSERALPAVGTPIVDTYAQLAAQARAGSAAAARRLADDLQRCERLPYLLDAAQRRVTGDDGENAGPAVDPAKRDNERSGRLTIADLLFKRYRDYSALCNGIEGRRSEHSEWLYLAARNGDAEAALCYALGPGPWETRLSPQWLDHAERARRVSGQLLRQAFEAGIPEAASVLSAMHSPDDMFSGNSWTGRLGNDPRQAYAYALVAEQALPDGLQPHRAIRLQKLGAVLTPQARQSARDWADAQLRRIRFQAPANPRESASGCTMQRSMGGF